MKRAIWIVVLALGLVSLLGGCLEDKVLDIVLTGETYQDFSENETGARNPHLAVIDVAEQIGQVLADNGYTPSDLSSAHVTSVSYGVTSFQQSHDWVLAGTIKVARDSGTLVGLVDYSDQSVQDALGRKIGVSLESAGVDLINQALADFLDGQSPMLSVVVQQGIISPDPSPTDPMVFEWRAWLAIQVIVQEKVTVPDPF